MQKLSEILHSKTYVGKSFSLQAKIILSKTSDLLKNTIKEQIIEAITDLSRCHLNISR